MVLVGKMRSARAAIICVAALALFAVSCGSEEPSLIPVSTLSDEAGNSAGAGQSNSSPGVTIAADTPVSSTSAPLQTLTSKPQTSATATVTLTRPPTTESTTSPTSGSPTTAQQGAAGANGSAPTPTEIEAEIETLLDRMLEAWAICGSDPQRCSSSTLLGAVYGGELLEVASAEISQRAAIGRRTLPPVNPANSQIELLEIRMDSIVSDSANITYCHVDGSILVETQADGTDLIINDSVASIVREADIERNASGQWRMVSRRSTALFENGLGCNQ